MMNFVQESLMVIRVVRLLSSQYPAQQPNIIIIIMFVIIIVVFSVVVVFIMIIITYHYHWRASGQWTVRRSEETSVLDSSKL